MATSLWPSIIISFFVGLLGSSTIHSNIRASSFATTPVCYEKCIRQNVVNVSAFTAELEESTSVFGLLSDVGHLMYPVKLTGLGGDLGGYLSSVEYAENLKYGCHTLISYLAKFDAIGTMEDDRRSVTALRNTAITVYESLPDQVKSSLWNVQDTIGHVYKALPDRSEFGQMAYNATHGILSNVRLLMNPGKLTGLGRDIEEYLFSINYTDNLRYGYRTVIRYLAKFDAIGTMEDDRRALMALRYMAITVYESLPDQVKTFLWNVQDTIRHVYKALPDRSEFGQMAYNENLRYGSEAVIRYMAKFDAIGSMEDDQRSLEALRYTAMFLYHNLVDQDYDALWKVYDTPWYVYKALPDLAKLEQMAYDTTQVDYRGAILRIVTNSVTAMQEWSVILSVAGKGMVERIAAFDKMEIGAAVVCGALVMATILFKLFNGLCRLCTDDNKVKSKWQKVTRSELGPGRKKRKYRRRRESQSVSIYG